MKTRFTIKDFDKMYPNDEACLNEIFKNRYGHLKICPQCNKKTKFYKVKNRKCYTCQYCGYQISPLSNTIFHKSSTSLKNWFYSLYLFSNSKNGVSAKELERHLGVTYKCAWRIAKQIRLLFKQSKKMLTNIVEADETYIGGKNKNKHKNKKIKGSQGRSTKGKTPIFGILERDGKIKVVKVKDVKSKTIKRIINENVSKGSCIITDDWKSYNILHSKFEHLVIAHCKGEYVNGIAHTNTIEGFWSQFKRSVSGTYHCVSPKYLQLYVDEFAYRYDNRFSSLPLFHNLVLLAVKQF